MKKAIVLILMSLFVSQAAGASTNYEYKELRPGEVYVNDANQTVQIKVKKDANTSKYVKIRDGAQTGINALNDTVNMIRSFTSMFGFGLYY